MAAARTEAATAREGRSGAAETESGRALAARTGWARAAIQAAGGMLILITIAWTLDLAGRLDLPVFVEQILALVLGFTLALAYLGMPARRRDAGPRPPWWDVAAAALGSGACLWIALRYPSLSNEIVYRPPEGVALGLILGVLILEAVRRVCGTAFTVVVLAFLAYALIGHLMPGQLQGRPVAWDRLAVYLALDSNAVLGSALLVAATVVIIFILMGEILSRGGGADYFNDVALAAMGRSRGGAAKITIVSSVLFGTISGSAVANTVSSGVMTIPLMKRQGYPATDAAAIEAVSSTGGQLVPPVMGAAAFLMAEFLQIPYGQVVIAAIVPSLFYYLAMIVWVDLQAAKRGYKPLPRSEIPAIGMVLREGWHFPIPFVALIYALFWMNMAPERAALLACVLLVVFGIVFGYRGKRLTLRSTVGAVIAAGAGTVDVLLICAAAGMVMGVLNLSGLAFGLTLGLVQTAGGSIVVLLVATAAISIVLGMGMPTVGVYVLLATLIGPAILQAGIDPLAGHMFLMYFGMLSMVTPPVALAAFAAASIGGADLWRTGWACMRVGWTAYVVPFLFVFEPALILKGDPLRIAVEVGTAAAGIWLGTAAFFGFLFAPMRPAVRMALAAAALVLLLPTRFLVLDGRVSALAALCALGVIAIQWRAARQRPVSARPGA